jgi:hypothetical protein
MFSLQVSNVTMKMLYMSSLSPILSTSFGQEPQQFFFWLKMMALIGQDCAMVSALQLASPGGYDFGV